ncbi:MAG TPA: LysR substrate-binding domain-containing protein [Amaricoccus sp.]|uniref:LysR substrate-binding domain-containing protein n=2 Tax=Amaricoccus TaxID=56999 RepID=UPI002BEE0432|nr:LysR substrate-binding domain-containing protein [Amaricoccus sp.]HRO12434.1 LysR substrate-binding domain-containing protein [Amaricoccus sp.]
MNWGMRSNYTPSIQELRALVACGRLGSASRAAETLHLTQSAVSRAVRSLEDRLGVRLFQRIRQRLVLSDAGRAMLRDAEALLDSLDASARMVMAFGGGDQVLRLAVLPTFATAWLIPRLADFHRRCPEVAIDVAAALHPVDFQDSPFDAALQRAVLARAGTTVLPVLEERLIVVAAPSLVPDTIPPRDQLARYPLIQQATRPRLWAEWFAAADAGPVERLRGPRFQHFDMVIAAARAGLGLGLVPDIFVHRDLAAGVLRRLDGLELAGPSPYALIYPAARPMSAPLRLFADWLRAVE